MPNEARIRALWHEADNRIHDWLGIQDVDGKCAGCVMITKYLGHGNELIHFSRITDEDQSKLEALCGPHGYAIYKAWEAKHEQE